MRFRSPPIPLPDPRALSPAQFRQAMQTLCDRGLLTCTRGRPGDDNATYALAWLPLDDGDSYPAEVREHHHRNMLRLRTEGRA